MNEIGKKITQKLIEIHGSTDFTIAFLPYKRSMWNSMASVYEECKAAGAQVHCMPIPYLRMKDNGKTCDYLDSDKEHFGELAENIEDLEHADFIAIHYQYEDHNKVTNMLPKYFTKALKERYGAKIVFLPYGIGMGQGHFSLQPGCRYIDYAFLEDQENAERFIAGWKTQGIDFTGRVFDYGSAKLDATRNLKKTIPEEWQELIGNRSVTLVCNSLGPFLSDPLKRMNLYQHYITNEIGAGKAVIFRPHPLLDTTIKSMIPRMKSNYKGLKIWAETRDRVIVDDSEYLERAIAAADYLISDPSSVITMWAATGKPYKLIV